MRINDGSICSDCKHFEHECYVPCGEDDYTCEEYCHCPNEKTRENFYDTYDDEIKECEGFKKD